MPAAVTHDNGRIRVEFSMRWYMRLPSLPLIAVSLLFLVVAAQTVRLDLSGYGRWSEAVVFSTLVLVLIFRPTGILGQQTADRA